MKRLTKAEKRTALDAAARYLRSVRKDPAKSRETVRVALVRLSAKRGAEVFIVACRAGEAKPVAWWYPGAPGFLVREIDWCGGLGGWSVAWDVLESNPCCGAWYRRLWRPSDPDEFVPWKPDARGTKAGGLALYRVLANPEALDGTRFRYVANCVGGENVFEVLAVVEREPRAELLVKAGLMPFARSRSKCARLAADKALLRLVARDPGFALSVDWSDLLWLAADPSRTREDARRRHALRHFWDGYRTHRVLEGVERAEVAAWCMRKRIDAADWIDAMEQARADGLDPRARCVSRPRNWAAFVRERAEAAAKRRRRENVGVDKRLRAAVAAFARRLERAGVDTGAFAVVWIRSQDEFVAEGRAMGNCIGGGFYASEMAARRSACFALLDARSGERVDVQVSRSGVRQCYGLRNGPASAAAKDAARRIAEALSPALREAA